MIQTGQPTSEFLEIDAPLASGPEAYLIGVMRCLSLCDQVFANLEGNTDNKPYFMTRQLVSRIPNDKIRLSLYQKLDAEMTRIAALDIPNEDRGKLKLEISQIIQGECIAYFESYIGIEKKQVIGQV